jgi:hypothetical protein
VSALRHLQSVDRETLRHIEGNRAVDVPVEHGFQPDDRVASHLYVDELQWRGQDGEPVPLSEQEAAVVVPRIARAVEFLGTVPVVHLDRAQVGDAVAVQRVAAALEFLDVVLVLGKGQQPGGATWPRT